MDLDLAEQIISSILHCSQLPYTLMAFQEQTQCFIGFGFSFCTAYGKRTVLEYGHNHSIL